MLPAFARTASEANRSRGRSTPSSTFASRACVAGSARIRSSFSDAWQGVATASTSISCDSGVRSDHAPHPFLLKGRTRVKPKKSYCSKHPGTRLPKHQRASGRKTGCRLCVRDYRARTRAQREAAWKRGDLRCSRHPNVRAIRSSYLSSGTRHCSRCHRYRMDGTRRAAGLRYEKRATATGHRAAWAANRRMRERLASNKF